MKDGIEPSPGKADDPPPYEPPSDLLPGLTNGFSGIRLHDAAGMPNADTCLAHLKLLEAFSMLRSDISTQDGVFGIKNPQGAQEGTDAMKMVEEKRWSIFVMQAAMRFQEWWQKVLQPSSRMLSSEDLAKDDWHRCHLLGRPLSFTANAGERGGRANAALPLPPLDVLMVWHAFMLNPRNFLADCIRFGKIDVWATGMPWKTVNDAIDNHTFAYIADVTTRSLWEDRTGLPWDPNTSSPNISVSCWKCGKNNAVPWTTSVDSSAKTGTGYADPDFEKTCPNCGFISTHQTQRVLQFRRDLEWLLYYKVPMPGTFLGIEGRPGDKQRSGGDLYLRDVDYPNTILHLEYGKVIYDRIEDWKGNQNKHVHGKDAITMDGIRSAMEEAIKDGLSLRRKLRSPPVVIRPSRDSRIAVRRMMGAYWDNSSIFSMDLVGAVIRQGNFVNKMHEIDWLHSPTAKSTMERLVSKYFKFFEIMSHHLNKVSVPTLDVDLAWHTHQLSPRDYYSYCLQNTGRTPTFIDHDDKIEDSKLSEAFAWTSKKYFDLTGQVYSECTCWYCEAIHESYRPSGLSGVFKKSDQRKLDSEIERLTHDPETSSDPNKNSHISAHSAIPVKDGAMQYWQKIHWQWLARNAEKSRQRAAKKERKEGRRAPERNQASDPYLAAGLYAYPYPIVATPYPAGIYVADPGCASMVPGTSGACCSATCGGAVAAGACAGGSCAGGTVGGSCAGGSGGGCGGGGGGGGGGCGGGGGGGGGGCGGGGGGGC